MFFDESQYPEEIQNIINTIEKKQKGLQVINAKAWSLPCYSLKLKLEISKEKTINIIEEFIIKLALSYMGEEVTIEIAEEILGLDGYFVSKYVNSLSEAGNLNKDVLPVLKVTELGKKQYEKGNILIKGTTECIELTLSNKFKKIYDNLDISEKSYETKNFDLPDYDIDSLIASENFMEDIANFAKEIGIIVNKQGINQFLNKISLIEKKENNTYINFVECWIYNMVDKNIYCHVWNLKKGNIDIEISEYFNKIGLSKQDFAVNSNVNFLVEKGIVDEYEEKFINEIKEDSNKNETNVKMLRGSDIKNEFLACLNKAKGYLLIQSPWISETVVDDEILNLLSKLAEKNCKVFITWGISRKMETEDRKPTNELLEKLGKIKDKNGLPSVIVNWIGNHHNKEIIVDDALHLAGSFNWLSYRGDYLPRGESAYIICDKEAIKNAKIYWEKQIFEKIIKDDFEGSLIKNVTTLLNLKTLESDVTNFIANFIEKLANIKVENKYSVIYNCFVVYFKLKKFDENFVKMFRVLIENENYFKKVEKIILYLKENNQKLIADKMTYGNEKIFFVKTPKKNKQKNRTKIDLEFEEKNTETNDRFAENKR